MAEIFLIKRQPEALTPLHDSDLEILGSVRVGEVIKAKFVKPRNVRYHRKFFSLLAYAFANWETDQSRLKDAEHFRKDILILAGFYDQVLGIDGKVKLVAQSMSFAKCSEDKFNRIYNQVLNAILKHVLTTHSEQDVVDNVLRYDG